MTQRVWWAFLAGAAAGCGTVAAIAGNWVAMGFCGILLLMAVTALKWGVFYE